MRKLLKQDRSKVLCFLGHITCMQCIDVAYYYKLCTQHGPCVYTVSKLN